MKQQSMELFVSACLEHARYATVIQVPSPHVPFTRRWRWHWPLTGPVERQAETTCTQFAFAPICTTSVGLQCRQDA